MAHPVSAPLSDPSSEDDPKLCPEEHLTGSLLPFYVDGTLPPNAFPSLVTHRRQKATAGLDTRAVGLVTLPHTRNSTGVFKIKPQLLSGSTALSLTLGHSSGPLAHSCSWLTPAHPSSHFGDSSSQGKALQVWFLRWQGFDSPACSS